MEQVFLISLVIFAILAIQTHTLRHAVIYLSVYFLGIICIIPDLWALLMWRWQRPYRQWPVRCFLSGGTETTSG
jgi:hypothetical protein